MPHFFPDSLIPPVPSGAEVPTLPPALRRRLRHVATVKSLRPTVALITAVVAVATAAGFVLPALEPASIVSASITRPAATQAQSQSSEQSESDLQTLTVAPVAAAAPQYAPRDSYSAVLLPRLQYPVVASAAVASGYGPRSCSGCASTFHEGIDIFPGAGTPIHAIASGTVIAAVPVTKDSMGVYLEIEHRVDGELVTSIYGHIADGTMTLRVGDAVTVGDVIGLVGATGNASGAHLHFEIHPGGGASVNPYEWLAPRVI